MVELMVIEAQLQWKTTKLRIFMLSTTLEEAYATREWVINEKNETLSLLEVANTKHEITKDMQQSVQKENAELRAKVEN